MSRIATAGAAGLLLLLGACAEEARPVASTNRIFYVDTQGRAAGCTVPRSVSLNRESVTEAAMTLANDGGWCGISLAQDGKPYAAGGVSARPEHGRVHVRNVGDATRVDYFPDRGFTGTDSFIVALVPGGHRMKVNVTVQPGPNSTAAAAPPTAAPVTTPPAGRSAAPARSGGTQQQQPARR